MGIRNELRLTAATSALMLGLVSTQTLAQETDQEEPAAEEAIPSIVVTGSRIRGIEPVGSNVIAIGADDIAQAPVMTTNEARTRLRLAPIEGGDELRTAAAAPDPDPADEPAESTDDDEQDRNDPEETDR